MNDVELTYKFSFIWAEIRPETFQEFKHKYKNILIKKQNQNNYE